MREPYEPRWEHGRVTTLSSAEVLQRASACLYGLAIGDALGMPTQELPRRRAASVLTVDDFVAAPDDQVVSHGMVAGSVTDDTEQALVVAELLVSGGGEVAAEALAERLLSWEQGMAARGSLDLLGPSTRRALAAIADGADPRSTGSTGATNGAAMRIAPVGVAVLSGDASRLVHLVVAVNRPTHDTGLAHAGAAAVAAVVSSGLDGVGFTAALPWALECARLAAGQGHWVAGADVSARVAWAIELVHGVRERSGGEAALDAVAQLVGTSLATQESVPAAFAVASLHTDEPWQAVLAAARLGGDSDTIAAMTGAMLGAGHGMSAWPEAAVQQVRDVNGLDLDPVAEGLVRLRQRLGAPS